VTALNTLRGGHSARLSKWVQPNQSVLVKGRQEGQEGHMTTEAETQKEGLEDVTLLSLKLDNGATSQRM